MALERHQWKHAKGEAVDTMCKLLKKIPTQKSGMEDTTDKVATVCPPFVHQKDASLGRSSPAWRQPKKDLLQETARRDKK